MKAANISILFVLLVCAPVYSSAESVMEMPQSQIIDLFRQCYLESKNCQQVQSLTESFGATAQDRDNFTAAIKKTLQTCSEARVNMASLKTSSRIIEHNYKLLECWFADKNNAPSAEDNQHAALDDLSIWSRTLVTYFDTEYQLGHLTIQEYVSVTARQSQTWGTLYGDTYQYTSMAAQIEQLKAQVASLQSADHERCRQIQLLAALHGATPQVCP